MGEKGKKKKEKKKKKKKEPKEKKPKGPNCVETLSAGLNLADRDGKSINTDVCLDFDDVLAEPGSTHGLDPVWQISFVLFSQTKLWLYRIFAALVAIPPALRLFELGVAIARRVFVGVMRCTVEPICSAVGAIFSGIGVSQRSIVQEA